MICERNRFKVKRHNRELFFSLKCVACIGNYELPEVRAVIEDESGTNACK